MRQKSSWVNFSKTFFYENDLECFIMIYLNDGLSSIITFYEFVYAFTLYFFAVRPELWMSHFSDVREGGIKYYPKTL